MMRSAECVIVLAGELGEKLGYYSSGLALSEGGEALTVSDGVEAWMMHLVPANQTKDVGLKRTTCVWAASAPALAGHVSKKRKHARENDPPPAS